VSHAFALDSGGEGGDAAARRLARANLLVSGIGLPRDVGAGVRIGTNEIVRWGIAGEHLDELADLVAAAWHADDPSALAAEVSSFRQRFTDIGYCT
jgi:glycine hydroxymethyltransferase